MPQLPDPNAEKIAELTGRVTMLEGYVLLLTSALLEDREEAGQVLARLGANMRVAMDELRLADPDLSRAETVYAISHWHHLRQLLGTLLPEHKDVLSGHLSDELDL